MSALLEVRDLGVSYGGVLANDHVSLDVAAGTVVGLIGPNGAGKTTFIDALTGFTRHTGDVEFDGRPAGRLPAHRRVQRGMSRTFQSLELFEDLTVRENLLAASTRHAWWTVFRDLVRPRRAHRDEDLGYALDVLGLHDAVDAMPAELSHGRRKLVAVARALITRPRLLLLDEPAAGLSSADSLELGRELRRVCERGVTIFLVDHDMGLVLSTCDYIYVLDFGKVIAAGTPAQIRSNPVVIAAYLGQQSTAEGTDSSVPADAAVTGGTLPTGTVPAAASGPAEPAVSPPEPGDGRRPSLHKVTE